MKRVAVLSTGSELMHGMTIDTNGSFICSRLFPFDLRVSVRMVAGDDPVDLERALRHSIDESDIVIMTGGLGPTDDDNTVEALRRIYLFPIVPDHASLKRMEEYFARSGITMNEKDMKMAEVPDGARVLPNEKGLAPGFVFVRDDKIVMALPGVPSEMEDMFDRSVITFLKKECGIGSRASVSFRVTAMKESDINASVLAMNIPLERFEWGMTAKDGITTLTFAAFEGGDNDLSIITAGAERVFRDRYLDPAWNWPEEEVIDLLRKKKTTLAVAESCTGGLISKRLTDVPGASDVFAGSVIAYANSVKISHLDVPDAVLSRHGAVSAEVAEAMAAGARFRLGADIGLSTTGIAGPGGGTEAKPVGTVWFGFADAAGITSFTHRIAGERGRVRSRASLVAIEYLRRYLKHMADQ